MLDTSSAQLSSAQLSSTCELMGWASPKVIIFHPKLIIETIFKARNSFIIRNYSISWLNIVTKLTSIFDVKFVIFKRFPLIKCNSSQLKLSITLVTSVNVMKIEKLQLTSVKIILTKAFTRYWSEFNYNRFAVLNFDIITIFFFYWHQCYDSCKCNKKTIFSETLFYKILFLSILLFTSFES